MNVKWKRNFLTKRLSFLVMVIFILIKCCLSECEFILKLQIPLRWYIRLEIFGINLVCTGIYLHDSTFSVLIIKKKYLIAGISEDGHSWWVDKGCEAIFEVIECPNNGKVPPPGIYWFRFFSIDNPTNKYFSIAL